MNTNEYLINAIAEGKAKLLGIEQICERLSISRTTFDRWRNSDRNTLDLTKQFFSRIEDVGMSFPPPDIMIGKSPKWTEDTFKKWIRRNAESISTQPRR